ncbi:MAG: lipopolysaccharide biosynthesis protein [Cyanobacteria bacterium P01_F01_bin.53]
MLKQKLSNFLSDKFIRNVGALIGGEALSRVFRLALVVFIARLLSPYDYGLAAIILTVREFATTFTMRGGITGKLIQADAKDLKQLTNTAYWLNWIFCVALFVLQCALAFPIAWFYKDTALIWPIIAVGTTYLAIPVYSTQMSLLERDNKLQVLAASMTVENMASNVGTLMLAFAGWGVWSLILPGVILSPLIQIYCAYRYHSWRPTQRFSLERWQEIMSFGAGVVGAQLMDKFRSYLDYLLVGKFLGVELLGLYFFAFNSGLGISLSVIDKFTWAQFPYICEAKDNAVEFKRRYFKSIKTIAYIICPLVILQSALAPFYVPIVFGQQWRPAIPVMILICLSAIPRPFGYAASRLLQAIDRTDLDVKWNLLFTTVFSILLLGVVQAGLIPVAATVLISHIVAIGLFVMWANRFVFDRQRESINREVVPAIETSTVLHPPDPGQNAGSYSGPQPQRIEDSMPDPIQSS